MGKNYAVAIENLLTGIDDVEQKKRTGGARERESLPGNPDKDKSKILESVKYVFDYNDAQREFGFTAARAFAEERAKINELEADDTIDGIARIGKISIATQKREAAISAGYSKLNDAEYAANNAVKVINNISRNYHAQAILCPGEDIGRFAINLSSQYAELGDAYEKALMYGIDKGKEYAVLTPGRSEHMDVQAKVTEWAKASLGKVKGTKPQVIRYTRLPIPERAPKGMDIHVVSSLPKARSKSLEGKDIIMDMLEDSTNKITQDKVHMFEDKSAPKDGNRQFYILSDEWNKAIRDNTPLINGYIIDSMEPGQTRGSFDSSKFRNAVKEVLQQFGWDEHSPLKRQEMAIADAVRTRAVTSAQVQQYLRLHITKSSGAKNPDRDMIANLKRKLSFAESFNETNIREHIRVNTIYDRS